MLKTELDSPEMAERIEAAFAVSDHADTHEDTDCFYEHGQHWIRCLGCGASWSVVDAEGGPAIDGFDFEEIDAGDDSCTEDEPDDEDEEDPDEETEAPDQETLNDNAVLTEDHGRTRLTMSGKTIGTYADEDKAIEAFRKACAAGAWWPDLYRINDHGNIDLLDEQTGAIIASWV